MFNLIVYMLIVR